MSEVPHVLVVDDDPRIRSVLRRYLIDEGFRVTDVDSGTAMRDALARDGFDIVLLDVMIPGEDGLSLARHIRQRSQVPIIMLTGKSDVIDRVAGLEAGADDYIAKPFHLREVLARIRTVMRRAGPGAPPNSPSEPHQPAPQSGETLVFQGWRLDLLRRELRQQGGDIVPLTSGEFDLLHVFASHPNRVLSRNQLMDLMKGREWAAYDRAIDTQVVRLRKKIEADPAKPQLIKTVRGAGYIFTTAVTAG